jgi:leucine dehydrogenase
VNPELDLYAIVAIHSTRLGPALGGCRCLTYGSVDAAVRDAIRLARGMSYKAALSGLALGGGKAVLMRPDQIPDRGAYFEAFGAFVEDLGGRYITSVDSGTGVQDMDAIAHRTSHVTATSTDRGGSGNPSPTTALGVCIGIEAAARWTLKRSGLEGLHVAIQGVGHVGYELARLLHERGARLTVSDHNPESCEACADQFHARVVAPESIYQVNAEVFSPCALGGVLNAKSIPQLRVAIVAGAANNQLATPEDGARLFRAGILYAPDYVVNAGGLMHVAPVSGPDIRSKVQVIEARLTQIFQLSAEEGRQPEKVANSLAEYILSNRTP